MFSTRRGSVFLTAAATVALSLPLSPRAIVPNLPPSCSSAASPSASNATPVAISSTGTPTISSQIVVAGAPPFLYDVDVAVSISHTSSSDLDITLTSPSGRVVTLSTDNGLAFDNIFAATTWDDDADVDGTVPFATNASSTTDTNYSFDNMTGFPLTPEEPLAAFVGISPNGTWTLTVSDDTAGNGGTLNNWSLILTPLATTPALLASNTASNTTPVIISSVGPTTVVSTLNAPSGGSIFDVDVTADIAHTSSGTLQMNLISPAGTTVTLTSNNGGTNDDVFAGVTWDDSADPDGVAPYASNDGLTTDHVYSNGITPSSLAPEEGLGAFIGENPQGTWTLRLADVADLDGGTINSWSLSIESRICVPTDFIFADGFEDP